MYSYFDLLDDVNYLAHFNVETKAIGSSVGGRLIPYIFLGDKNADNNIIITAGIHAREHVSSLMVMRQIFYLLNGNVIKGGGVYFVPMVNPDGNMLCAYGTKYFAAESERLIKINNGSSDFSLYKANLNGVDLNVNFDAYWGKGESNVFSPAAANYVGNAPFSEPETRALRDFTLKIKPKATISYHALGQEIYWDFYQTSKERQRDHNFAVYVNSFLNYKLINGAQNSAGGYKDYCIDKLKIPALTIELVSPDFSHPLPDDSIVEDFMLNKDLPQHIINYFSVK